MTRTTPILLILLGLCERASSLITRPYALPGTNPIHHRGLLQSPTRSFVSTYPSSTSTRTEDDDPDESKPKRKSSIEASRILHFLPQTYFPSTEEYIPTSEDQQQQGEDDNKSPDDDDDGWDCSSAVCRVVALSDARLPTSQKLLPDSLFQPPQLLNKLDAIYHAVAHEETRRLKYMDRKRSGTRVYDEREEKETVDFLRISLEDAGFQLLSKRDVDLCESLNTGYLLRLSLLPDVAECDSSIAQEFYPERFFKNGTAIDEDEILFGGRVMVYWRGYSEEISEGRLILPKIDYLQTSIVQRLAASVRAQVEAFEKQLYASLSQSLRRAKHAARKVDLVQTIASKFNGAEEFLDPRQHKKASPSSTKTFFELSRYGGSKIRFVGSPNPTDALTPFLLCELDGGKPTEVDHDMYDGLNHELITCQYDAEHPHRGSNHRAMQLLERVSISDLVDVNRKTLLNTIFSKSKLVEPTYEEVVVVWRPLPPKPPRRPRFVPPKFVYDFADMFDLDGLPLPPLPEAYQEPDPCPLEIRAFTGVPMANLPAVLPKTKLVFRPADALVFDFVSVFSLLLVLGSQKFDNPKLDLIALLSVIVWVVRTVIRYSNKLARYDLLVKKFLTSKISHRNSGALKYIAMEAGSQRATRVSLVHSWILRLVQRGGADRTNGTEVPLTRTWLKQNGETGVNSLLQGDRNVRVDMDATLNDIEDLALIRFSSDGDELSSIKEDPTNVVGALKHVWSKVFDGSLTGLMGRRNRYDD